MWKHIGIALVSGLALSPGMVLGQTYDPFKELASGISQGMEVPDISIESRTDSGVKQGGNVIIGSDSAAGDVQQTLQRALIHDDIDLVLTGGNANSSGEKTVQGLNVLHGTVTVLSIQGVQLDGIDSMVRMQSSGSSGTVQGVNVVSMVP